MKRAADSVVFFRRLNRSSCSLEGTTVLEKPNRERTFIKKFHYTVAAAALHKTGRETTFPSLYINFSSFQRKSVEVRFELNTPLQPPHRFYAPNERWFWCWAKLDWLWLWGLFRLTQLNLATNYHFSNNIKRGSNSAVVRIINWMFFGEFSHVFSWEFVTISFHFSPPPAAVPDYFHLSTCPLPSCWRGFERRKCWHRSAITICKKQPQCFFGFDQSWKWQEHIGLPSCLCWRWLTIKKLLLNLSAHPYETNTNPTLWQITKPHICGLLIFS